MTHSDRKEIKALLGAAAADAAIPGEMADTAAESAKKEQSTESRTVRVGGSF
jgi:hypothetical protein